VYHQRGGTTGPQTRFLIYHTEKNNLLLVFKVLPTSFITGNLPLILLSQAGEIAVYARRGRLHTILNAKLDAVKMLGKMLLKRRKFFEKGVRLNLNDVVEKALLPPVSAVSSLP